MRILLDTHCWLWLCAEPDRLSRATLDELADPSTERLLSAASVWEIVIKHGIGKLPLPVAPRDFVPSRLAITRTTILAISAAHALRVGELADHHRDPFDRMLVAQSLIEGIPLLTGDNALARYDVELKNP